MLEDVTKINENNIYVLINKKDLVKEVVHLAPSMKQRCRRFHRYRRSPCMKIVKKVTSSQFSGNVQNTSGYTAVS